MSNIFSAILAAAAVVEAMDDRPVRTMPVIRRTAAPRVVVVDLRTKNNAISDLLQDEGRRHADAIRSIRMHYNYPFVPSYRMSGYQRAVSAEMRRHDDAKRDIRRQHYSDDVVFVR